MRLQSIYDIAEICVRKGIRNAVLCPGSRCAPLTLAFTRNEGIVSRTFSDERSAAFVALGIAQQTKTPPVLICTSGTAVYNFAPAVAEACFSETPLIIFSADRPSEWIGQHDGQTIHQSDVFGKHVKGSFELPQDYEHTDSQWAINRIVNEAINLAMQEPKGPVHINTPFREPLYPLPGEKLEPRDVRIIEDAVPFRGLSVEAKQKIGAEFQRYNNILVVAGQSETEPGLYLAIEKFSSQHNIPVAGDIITNLHSIENLVRHTDTFLGQAGDGVKETLRPDLLITFGKSIVSKNLKLFLRKYSPAAHWHIQASGTPSDTFQTLTQIIRCDPASFFSFAISASRDDKFTNQKQHNYYQLWEVEERRAARSIEEFFPQQEFGEFELVREVIRNLPANANLHLANSMSVRYANFIGLKAEQAGIRVFSNRGTSGIDGCTSTAVGHALSANTPNVLVTGDMAFFYDRNAFWHNYNLPNLRVVILNNHGGIIFKMIDGPGTVPESDEYFVTHQKLTAHHLCLEYGFDHLKLDSKRKLKNLLKDFFELDGKTKILEMETGIASNKMIVENLKEKIKKSYEL